MTRNPILFSLSASAHPIPLFPFPAIFEARKPFMTDILHSTCPFRAKGLFRFFHCSLSAKNCMDHSGRKLRNPLIGVQSILFLLHISKLCIAEA